MAGFKTTVPDALAMAIDALALERGLSRSALICEILTEYVAEDLEYLIERRNEILEIEQRYNLLPQFATAFFLQGKKETQIQRVESDSLS